jgi:hypothetical protein
VAFAVVVDVSGAAFGRTAPLAPPPPGPPPTAPEVGAEVDIDGKR